MKLLIAAAGTGGHIYPALAVAKMALKNFFSVAWLGTPSGMENHLVANHNIPFFAINFSGVRHKGWGRWFAMPWQLYQAFRQSLELLKKNQYDVVLVMGGYISVPITLAAFCKKIPIVIHEQNSVAGLANIVCSLFAKKVCEAFPNAFQKSLVYSVIKRKIITTGNPVRENILNIKQKIAINSLNKNINILIIGGSLGAGSINQHFPDALSKLIQKLKNNYPKISYSIVHQTGKNKAQTVIANYKSLKLKATVLEFLDSIDQYYKHANLIIARAGAMTVSELDILNIPAILIPYPYAVNDHQFYNAQFLQQKKQVLIIRDNQLANNLDGAIINFVEKHIKNPIKQYSNHEQKSNATNQIMEECLTLIANK